MFTHCQDMKIVRRAGGGEADVVANRLARGGEARGEGDVGERAKEYRPTREGADRLGNDTVRITWRSQGGGPGHPGRRPDHTRSS